MKRISIVHRVHESSGRWDWFYAELVDDSALPEHTILGTASGPLDFIFRVAADWLRDYKS